MSIWRQESHPSTSAEVSTSADAAITPEAERPINIPLLPIECISFANYDPWSPGFSPSSPNDGHVCTPDTRKDFPRCG
jgi:hypothetical protein